VALRLGGVTVREPSVSQGGAAAQGFLGLSTRRFEFDFGAGCGKIASQQRTRRRITQAFGRRPTTISEDVRQYCMIDYHHLKNRQFADVQHSYDKDFSMSYALALGIGGDPLDERDLRYVNDVDAGTPVALPTLCTVVGFPGTWMREPDTGIDVPRILHGEELIVLHEPMPAAATLVARHRVTRVVDKGAGRGAVVTYDKELLDKATGRKVATVTHTTFARGDGGFSARDGRTDTAPPPPPKVPDGPPDRTFTQRTLAQQALLYRLCADRNPLHSTPSVARAAGFERPILHGLCSYGIAAFGLLKTWADSEPARMSSLFCRFSAPVFPGETLRVEMYRQGGGVAFRVRVVERDVVALDHGFAQLEL
jgi:acyl dehydratase